MKFALAALVSLVTGCAASGQVYGPQQASTIPVGLRFVTTRAHETPGGATFFLTGGAADAAVPLLPHISAAVEVAGTTTQQVPGTSRGLSTITLLAGPRYTQHTRRISLSLQALFGAVRGFDADFSTATTHADTSTAFAFAAGGFIDIPVTHAIALRAVQLDYLQTQLPNGADNRQGGIRLGAGLVFRVGMPAKR